ncbi:MAG: ABC transporter ATP-binding protein [Cyclonatronaceae bacterium]
MAAPAVSLQHLKKSFAAPLGGPGSEILNIPEFSLPEQTHAALRGASGSGKTTLLHCISGMRLPDEGKVMVLGTAVNQLNEARRDQFRAAHIGYIFQNFNLLDGFTALENVQLGMQFAGKFKSNQKQRAKKLLEEVGLGARLHNKPSQLSAGQQQRVCIARALANDPELLLADEPTGALDSKTSAEVIALIKNMAAGRSLLLVSHENEVLREFDTVHDLATLNHVSVL